MVKILHTADLHVGAPSAHPLYHKRTIPELFKLSKQENCDYILVVGDIFDKAKPDQQVKDFLVRQLLDYRGRAKIIFVPGNHDYTTKSLEYHNLTYLTFLREVNTKVNIFVVEPGEFRMFNKFNLYAMDSWGNIDLPVKEHKGPNPLILAWHGVLPGMQFTDIEFVPKSLKQSIRAILDKARAQYIALGDIHRPIKIHKRCWYPGPPTQKTYADIDNVLIVNITSNTISVNQFNLPLPKKITLDIKFEEGKDSEDTLIKYIKQNAPARSLLRVRFEVPLTVWGSINKNYIKKELSKRFSEVVLENDPVVDVRTRKTIEKISKAKSIFEELEIALKTEAIGLNIDKLRKFCKRYI